MKNTRCIVTVVMLMLLLNLLSCQATAPKEAPNVPPSEPSNEQTAPSSEASQESADEASSDGATVRSSTTVGCILYRSPFHELRAKSECIILGTVIDVQSQSSTVDYVTVAVEQTYQAYGESTFATIRVHQMVSEDSLANHVGKTCLLFLKKHPAGEADVFYGVDSMKGIMIYDAEEVTLYVHETSFVCDALDEWLMEHVTDGQPVQVVDIHENTSES